MVKYLAENIADWFLCNVDREAGDSITHLKLQKLVYYAQAWSLALLNKPLFNEDFEAWTHGPVIPELYKKYVGKSWDSLEYPVNGCIKFEEDIENLLNEIMRIYGGYNAKLLEQLTHMEEPWIIARGNLPLEAKSSEIITKKSMKDFYFKKYMEANNGKEINT